MEIDQILKDYNNWLYKTARSLCKDSHKVEDLVQEGRIAMWKAEESYNPDKGSLVSWAMFKAKNRMLTSLVEDRWVGNTRPPGSLAAKSPTPVSDEFLTVEISHMPDFVLTSYHRDEIVKAINDLRPKQRQYVYCKFWLDYMPADLVEEFGSYSAASANWYRGSKDKGAKLRLQESLEHLRELA